MTYYQIVLRRKSTGATYTIDDTNNPRAIDRVYTHMENRSSSLEVLIENRDRPASENLMSSSFIWSTGSGALVAGDEVYYYLKPNELAFEGEEATAELVFSGFVTDIKQDRDTGQLKIEARDYLFLYENLRVDKNYFTSIRDRYIWEVESYAGFEGGKLFFEGVDSTALMPAAKVTLLCEDEVWGSGLQLDDAGSHDIDFDEVGDYVATSFYATHDELYQFGFLLGVTGDDTTSRMRVSIREDDSGHPASSDLFYYDIGLAANVSPEWTQCFPNTSGYPEELHRGRRYWIVVKCQSLNNPGTTVFKMRRQETGTFNVPGGSYTADGYATDCLHYYESGTGYSHLQGNLCLWLLLGNDVEIPSTDYHLKWNYYLVIDRLASGKLPGYSAELGMPFSGLSSYAMRGRLTYYYGTFTYADLIADLAQFEPAMDYCTCTSYCSGTATLFRTKGRTLAECFTELADMWLIQHTGHTHQGAFGCYKSSVGGAVTFYFDRRRDSTDDAVTTFAYGKDVADGYDYQRRILLADLQQATRSHPNTVMVTGKSRSGDPIVAVRDDRGRTYSRRTMLGYAINENINDDSCSSLQAASDRAWALLDGYNMMADTNTLWEGTITVSGVYSNLMGNSAFDQGGHNINIKYSPLGIDGKFHVKGIVVRCNTTTITVSNSDALYDNWLRSMKDKTWRSDSFANPADDQEIHVIAVYKSTTVTDTSVYMALEDTTGTERGWRVECTLLPSPAVDNINTYHAEFDRYNVKGYTIRYIKLYPDLTSSSPLATYDFDTEIHTVARFYKGTRNHLIVNFNCEAS